MFLITSLVFPIYSTVFRIVFKEKIENTLNVITNTMENFGNTLIFIRNTLAAIRNTPKIILYATKPDTEKNACCH